MIDANTGVIAADVRTLRTTDGGMNWVNQTSGRGADIFFTDIFTGYCVSGSGLIIKTINGGVNWFNVQNAGLYPNLNSVFFLNSENGIVAGNEGILLKTSNGGVNWNQISIPSDNKFNSIYFLNSNTGYIAGIYGTILKTTNGGISFIKSYNQLSPNEYYLFQNYPNPFNPSTTIKFNIKKSADIAIKIFDFSGKEILTLINEYLKSGSYEIIYNALDLSSGIYFYSLFVNKNKIDTKKLIFIK